MKKLKFFFSVFKRSLIDPKYYKNILKAPFSFSLKYLYFLLLILAFIHALVFSVTVAIFIPAIPRFLETTKTVVRNIYPDDLVITVKQGELSINQPEPYKINIPTEIKNLDEMAAQIDTLVTIDTQAQVSDYPDYNSFVLLTKDSVVFYDDDTNFSDRVVGYRVISLKDTEFADDAVLTKDIYLNLVNQVLPYLNYLKPLAYTLIILSLIIAPFVIAAFGLLLRLIYLLFIAAILWLFVKVAKIKLTYKKLYQLVLHTITLPIIFVSVFKLVGFHLPGVLSFSVLLIFSGFIIWKLKID